MPKPVDPREAEEKAKKKPGGQQHPNPPRKTDTNNPERNRAIKKVAAGANSSKTTILGKSARH